MKSTTYKNIDCLLHRVIMDSSIGEQQEKKMSRKTVNVDVLKDTINGVLANMGGDSPTERSYRRGMMSILEDVLHDTGNYKGFMYLTSERIPGDVAPGMFLDENNIGIFEGTDSTRVFYI